MSSDVTVSSKHAEPDFSGSHTGPKRLAWLPIPLLVAAIIVGRAAGLRESYNFENLRLVLSFIFYTLVSLGTLFLIGRNFLVSGAPGLLLLECGVILWSLAGTVGDAVYHGDANINITIFNTGILLASLCHLAGAILSRGKQRAIRAPLLWLGTGCALTLGALWLITLAVLAHRLPVFFIPGQGGTTVRYIVLISAITMFVLSAILLLSSRREARTPFVSWYALALLLMAVGLCGIMIQLSLGDVVNWLSRTAQWLSGFYLFLAATAALRESHLPLFPKEKASRSELYRYGVAIAIVLAATAVRLAFLQSLGTRVTFLSFYPAVILAALYGGLRAGMLATALSAILTDYFWMEPVGQLSINDPADILSLVVFVLSCAMICWVVEIMQRAQIRAVAAEEHAKYAAERQQAAEALRESEGKYRFLFDNNPDAIFTLDPTGHVVVVNPACESLSGYPVHELLQKSFMDICAPDQQQKAMDHFQRVLHERQGVQLETAIIRKDGSRLEVWIAAHPTISEGKVVGVHCTGKNITERKRAEEALARNEAKLRAVFRALTEGVVFLNTKGVVVEANEAVERTFGHTLEELTDPARDPRRRIVRQDGKPLPEEEQPAMVALRTGQPVRDVEIGVPMSDGRLNWRSVNAQPAYDDHGNLLGVVASFFDITERKQAEEARHQRAEEALRISEEEFRSLAEAVPQIVWVTRPDGWNIYFNQQWVDYTGMTMEESYGHSWNTPFHPDDKQRAWDAWQRATQHNERYSLECRLRRHDGVYRWWLIRGEPMRGANGEILKWFGTCTDIEDLKHAEATLKQANDQLEQRVAERTAALRQRERLLHDVIDGSTSPIFLKDLDGKFITINAPLERMLGISRDKLKGKTDYDIAPKEVADNWRNHDKQVMATGKAIQIEEKADLQDGCHIFLANKFPLKDAEGQTYGVGSISHDITDRKRGEEALLNAKAEAERANRAKDEFLAVLSHELRTPLTSMLGWVKILQTKQLDDAKTKHGLAVVERNAKLQTQLIEDLLDVSRIIAGKLRIEKATVDLAAIVTAGVDMLKPNATARGLVLEIAVQPGVYTFNGDAARLQQIVGNLLNNAIKFTPSGGRIDVTLASSDRGYLLKVSDTGCGISRDFLPNIFNRFAQEDSSTSRRYMGLGLGLALAKNLVELHGGMISVQSPGEGKGATFSVTLPKISSQARLAAVRPPKASEAPLKGKKILVVEDDADVRELLATALRMGGAETTEAGSVAEALQSLKAFRPDVLISDIGMPEENGFVMINKFRSWERELRREPAPALALTGYAQPEDHARCRSAGYNEHLSKPIDPERLINTVERMLKR